MPSKTFHDLPLVIILLQADVVDLTDSDLPLPLVRFKVNQHDTLAVFKACTKEDFVDVVQLLPQGTPLPASERMSYLLARLEVRQQVSRPVPAAWPAGG